MHASSAACAAAIPDLLLKAEVAEILRCHPASVDRLIAAGKLPALKWGATVRIRRSDVDAFLNASVTALPVACRDPLRKRRSQEGSAT